MAALATPDDLEARLGRDLTDTEQSRAEALLADASAMIRAYTGQTFDEVTGDVAVLRVQGGIVRLPQRPVTAVTSVVALGGAGMPDVTVIDWIFDGIDQVRLGEGSCVINLPEIWWDDDGYPGTYRITYNHGYATVPADVVAVTCGIILRVFGNPQGYRSETVGAYSVTYAVPATGEALGVNLTRYDRTALDRYRRSEGMIKVGR